MLKFLDSAWVTTRNGRAEMVHLVGITCDGEFYVVEFTSSFMKSIPVACIPDTALSGRVRNARALPVLCVHKDDGDHAVCPLRPEGPERKP